MHFLKQAMWAASCGSSKLAQQPMQLCDGSSKTLRVETSHEGVFLHPALALLHDGMPQKSEMCPGDLFKAGPWVPQLINHGISAVPMIKVMLWWLSGECMWWQACQMLDKCRGKW